MISETVDIVLVTLFLAGMVLLGLAMLVLVLRVGPRRGYWNQPAAMLRRPGRRMFLAMYALAALHVIVGLVTWLVTPGGEVAMFFVLAFTAVFYVLCAHAWGLAHSIARRRDRTAAR